MSHPEVRDGFIVGLAGDGAVFDFQDAGNLFQGETGLGQGRLFVEPDFVPAVEAGFFRPFFKFTGVGERAFHPHLAEDRSGLGRDQGFRFAGLLDLDGRGGIDIDPHVSFFKQTGGIFSGRSLQQFFLQEFFGRTSRKEAGGEHGP